MRQKVIVVLLYRLFLEKEKKCNNKYVNKIFLCRKSLSLKQ